MNEKGLSSIFVIFRVVDKLVECRETFKYFKRKNKYSNPYAAKGKATTSVVKGYQSGQKASSHTVMWQSLTLYNAWKLKSHIERL